MKQQVLILRPSQADVLGLSWQEYITKHEKRILAAGGVCKIVMPASMNPRRSGYDNLDMTISRAIRQEALGTKGMYRMLYVEQKPMSLAEFKQIAMDKDSLPSTSGAGRSGNTDDTDLERKFWKNVCIRPPLYGADVEGSLFDEKAKGWNLRHLDTLLSSVLEEAGYKLPGVNTPYLYFGQWRSVFAWHTEDLDLYSVNYLHFGAPKQWYVIPPEHSARFEYVIKSQVPEVFKTCPEYLRHKELLVSPQFLEQFQIPYMKLVQHAREFVVTYPGAYHAGFNHGFNCAESVNFATKRWIPIGARAGVCQCSSDAVKIDMRLFRHLVPASQLPQELLMDTSDEEDESESSAQDSDQDSQSGSEDSTTEAMAPSRNGRKRSHGKASLDGKGSTQQSPKRTRTGSDSDVGQAGGRLRARGGPRGKAAKPGAGSAGAERQAAAAQALQIAMQAQQRLQRAAARAGRPGVRERVMMRAAAAAPLGRASARLRSPPPPAHQLKAGQSAPPSTAAPAPRRRPAASPASAAARPAPPPLDHTAAGAATIHSATRRQRATSTQAEPGPAAPAGFRSRHGTTSPLPLSTALVTHVPARRSPRSTQGATAAQQHQLPTSTSVPATQPIPALELPLASTPNHHHCQHHHNHHNHHHGDDGTSNNSGASLTTIMCDHSSDEDRVPQQQPQRHPDAAQQHAQNACKPFPSTVFTAPAARSAAPVAAPVTGTPGSASAPAVSPASSRPRRTNAGVNRWFSSDAQFEMDETKWQPEPDGYKGSAKAGAPSRRTPGTAKPSSAAPTPLGKATAGAAAAKPANKTGGAPEPSKEAHATTEPTTAAAGNAEAAGQAGAEAADHPAQPCLPTCAASSRDGGDGAPAHGPAAMVQETVERAELAASQAMHAAPV